MMINSIRTYNIAQPQVVSFKSSAPSFHIADRFDTFERTTKPKSDANKVYPFSCRQHMGLYSVTPSICKKLKYDSIRNEDIKMIADESIEMAKLLKSFLVEKGEGTNNTYVCIGTSPAGVMKSMELMGEDVRYMPLSGLRNLKDFKNTEYIDAIFKELDTAEYKDFLSSIGLSADEINSREGKTIFYDYTLSGATLDIVKQLALHNGVDENKVEFRSLNKDLIEAAKNSKTSGMRDYVNAYILTHLLNSEIGIYAGIPHVDYRSLSDIKIELHEPISKFAEDFNFALLYNMEQQGLLNI